MRACCKAFNEGHAPPCDECRALLESDLFLDLQRDTALYRAEDAARERDLIAESIGSRTRRDGRL